MYDWLVSVLDFPEGAPEYVVYIAGVLVILAFCFISKLLYRSVFR